MTPHNPISMNTTALAAALTADNISELMPEIEELPFLDQCYVLAVALTPKRDPSGKAKESPEFLAWAEKNKAAVTAMPHHYDFTSLPGSEQTHPKEVEP